MNITRNSFLAIIIFLSFVCLGIFTIPRPAHLSSTDIFEAYSKWKATVSVGGSNRGAPPKHQAIAVSARQLNKESAKIESLVISDFDSGGKGFEVKVEAQPLKKTVRAGATVYENAGSNHRIVSSNRKRIDRDNLRNVIALSRFEIPFEPEAVAVRITVFLIDNNETEKQTFLIPLTESGYSSASGRITENLDPNALRNSHWAGLCQRSEEFSGGSKDFYDCR